MMERAMKTMSIVLGAGLLAALLPVGFSAKAADIAGAWAHDRSVCDKVFVKKGNTISLARNSDTFGSGFIVEGNRLRGKMATCTIKSRKDEGDTIQLIATCSTDIALSTVQFTLKMDGNDKLTRIFPGMPEMAMSYARCPF